ncbi:unnamed protein product [Symbiodinium sp. CCMP2592]|nr:unnamed protein product [Symbiodinium sp. CCMP2592]
MGGLCSAEEDSDVEEEEEEAEEEEEDLQVALGKAQLQDLDKMSVQQIPNPAAVAKVLPTRMLPLYVPAAKKEAGHWKEEKLWSRAREAKGLDALKERSTPSPPDGAPSWKAAALRNLKRLDESVILHNGVVCRLKESTMEEWVEEWENRPQQSHSAGGRGRECSLLYLH